MTALRRMVEDYVSVRRSLGFKLEDYPWMLHDFVGYLEKAGVSTVTAELAVAWAQLPGANAHPSYLAKRLSVVRGFARHLAAFDPATQIPSTDLLHHQECRATPYIYTDDDIAALMAAAKSLTPELRGATYQTLIGLLTVTGARIGELIGLDRDDVDLADGVLVIRYSKFNKSRELPLHVSTVEALKAYTDVRDRLCRKPKAASFFVSTVKDRLTYVTVQHTFAIITRAAGLQARSPRCRPRIHDVRHSFACATMLGWYRSDVDVEAHLPLLSTYMGHTRPEGTYWYLSAVPELLFLASQRRADARSRRP
jgi:integrase